MNIKGLHKTSLVDYPEKICAVIFTGGCNLRCKYCYNPDLVYNSSSLRSYTEEEILNFLKKRQGLIDGVTLTGGEPTLNENLYDFVKSIKSLPLSVKIDTNGLKPEIIEKLIKKGIVDYIAVDIKTSPEKYELFTNKRIDFSKIKRTIDIIRNSGINYELRTTCIPDFVVLEDLTRIKIELGRVKKYFLQQFANNITLDSTLQNYEPYPESILCEFKKFVETFAQICEIRGL